MMGGETPAGLTYSCRCGTLGESGRETTLAVCRAFVAVITGVCDGLLAVFSEGCHRGVLAWC